MLSDKMRASLSVTKSFCPTWIASTSHPTIARANTPCWNSGHITVCITYTMHWSPRRQARYSLCSGFIECICYIIFLYCISASLKTNLVSRLHLLLLPDLFLQDLLPLLFLLLHYLERQVSREKSLRV